MKDSNFRKVLCVRKAFQMTAVSVILVLIISIVIVVTTGNVLEEADCGPVENLRVIEEDLTIAVTWDRPLGADCHPQDIFPFEVTLNGEHLSSGIAQQRHLEFDKESCKTYSFTITSTHTTGRPLLPKTIQHESGIAGTGQVNNLQLTGDRLSWTQPDNSASCDIIYRVTVASEGVDLASETVRLLSTTVSLIPCGEHTLSVISITNGREGLIKSIERTGPVTRLEPEHGSTWPTNTGATVTWFVKEEVNACEIEGIEFDYFLTPVEGVEPTIDTQWFIKNSESQYTLEDLTPGELYTYKARWRLEGGNGDNSNTIDFKTTALTPPESITSTQSGATAEGNTVRIHWEQDYPSSFITGHVITIEYIGRRHFVPEECEIDEDHLLRTYPLEAGVNQIDITPVFPDTEYNITVTTVFGNLNVETTSYYTFIANIARPGKIEYIRDEHNFEHGIEYSVLKHVHWKIPCDANGPLDKFEIRIVGELDEEDVNTEPSSCSYEFFSTSIPCEEEICSISTDRLIPFFKYTVFIKAVSQHNAEYTSLSEWKLTSMPNAYTQPLN